MSIKICCIYELPELWMEFTNLIYQKLVSCFSNSILVTNDCSRCGWRSIHCVLDYNVQALTSKWESSGVRFNVVRQQDQASAIATQVDRCAGERTQRSLAKYLQSLFRTERRRLSTFPTPNGFRSKYFNFENRFRFQTLKKTET